MENICISQAPFVRTRMIVALEMISYTGNDGAKVVYDRVVQRTKCQMSQSV